MNRSRGRKRQCEEEFGYESRVTRTKRVIGGTESTNTLEPEMFRPCSSVFKPESTRTPFLFLFSFLRWSQQVSLVALKLTT